jgi:hypothetical protein
MELGDSLSISPWWRDPEQPEGRLFGDAGGRRTTGSVTAGAGDGESDLYVGLRVWPPADPCEQGAAVQISGRRTGQGHGNHALSRLDYSWVRWSHRMHPWLVDCFMLPFAEDISQYISDPWAHFYPLSKLNYIYFRYDWYYRKWCPVSLLAYCIVFILVKFTRIVFPSLPMLF